jgi:hypothetical protein
MAFWEGVGETHVIAMVLMIVGGGGGVCACWRNRIEELR